MSKLLCVIWISLATVSALCQSTGKYQVGTITDVKPHQVAADAVPDVVSYDVSLKVKDTIYLLLYTPPARRELGSVRFGARHSGSGREENDYL